MIGEQIKKIRNEQGLAQSAVAERSGISYVMIGLIERNKTNPSLGTLDKIAQAMNCNLVVKLQPKKIV